jgi:hypothetical protein
MSYRATTRYLCGILRLADSLHIMILERFRVGARNDVDASKKFNPKPSNYNLLSYHATTRYLYGMFRLADSLHFMMLERFRVVARYDDDCINLKQKENKFYPFKSLFSAPSAPAPMKIGVPLNTKRISSYKTQTIFNLRIHDLVDLYKRNFLSIILN